MALGASDGHSQERAGNGVDRVHGQFLWIRPSPSRQEPEGKHIAWAGLALRSVARRRHLGALVGASAGELNLHELVVGQVFVQGPNDPVPPQVDAGRGCHALVGVGISQHVQPVPSVADGVLLIGQQTVDDLPVGIGRGVSEECLLLGRRWGDACEVEMHSPEERPAVRWGLWLDAAGDGQEAVDRVIFPEFTSGNGRSLNRLERPPRQALGSGNLRRAAQLLSEAEHQRQ